MSHVDEGRIHAWLDNALLPGDPERAALEAHIAACDECRARVEAERRIRDRASAVLRTAAPDAVRVEPFEQMIAARRAARAAAETVAGDAGASVDPAAVPGRVESVTPITEAPSRRRRYVPLAWAASLVMAVSAGWFARAYLPDPAMQERTESLARDEALEADAATAPSAPQAGSPRADVVRAPAPAGQTAAATAATEGEARVGEAAGRQIRRPTEETKRLADAMVLDPARTQETAQKAAAPPPAAMPVANDVVLDAADAAALATYRAASWVTLTEAEAAVRLGRAPARIEGLAVDSLQAAPHDGGWLVRVVQGAGPGGGSVEVLQWRAPLSLESVVVTGAAAGEQRNAVDRRGVAADSAARPRAERQALAGVTARVPAAVATSEPPTLPVRISGYRVLLRAAVSADSLAALAARIR